MSAKILSPCRKLAVTAALFLAATCLQSPSLAAGAEKLVSFKYVVYVSRGNLARYGSPVQAPVCVYLHGANHQNEHAYEPLLEDLADSTGYIVVYPTYDARYPERDASQFYSRAKQSATEALSGILSIDTLLPFHGIGNFGDGFGSQVILAGHSLGGMYALRMANDFAREGPARPRSIVLHDPSGFGAYNYAAMQGDSAWLNNLTAIPRDTFLMIVASDDALTYESGSQFLVGRNTFSGVWKAAWSSANTNIYNSFKYAALAPGAHQGMLRDQYDVSGAPYLYTLQISGIFNWWLPASWYSGDVTGADDLAWAFDWLFP